MNFSNSPTSTASRVAALRWLRGVGLAEGISLIALVFIAVPAKYLADFPAAVSALGPIHGAMFLLYFWLVIQTIAAETWTKGQILRLVVAAIVPFGTFANDSLLRKRCADLRQLNGEKG